MDNPNLSAHNQDDRIMAALSHVSVFLPLMGLVIPVVIWATQKEKSRYVAFQSLQAIGLHLCMMVGWFAGMVLYVLSFIGTFASIGFFSSGGPNAEAFPGPVFFVPFLAMGLMGLGWFAFIVYGVVGAIISLQGKPFRYVLIGRAIERFMASKPYAPVNPENN